MQDIEISFDLSRIDFRATSDQLMQSYWGASRTDEAHRRAFDNSLCAGAYLDGEQVGFARAITDYTVFAYVADVIIWPQHRGRGIGKLLVQALIDHPEVSTVTHWSLSTDDAHSLYEKFGFKASTDGRYMRLDRKAGKPTASSASD
ncbi:MULTISPECIES: GNAT family N-acetyltransferase [unclassified Mesorhizobium]|uniref:GNAT family N-acetyltransferase n=1 Tax=unclassified Mesorhizobium TaxID=325217 RepID=UPI000F7654E7|nr:MULTISPECIES: GNAT family N-acetyltransferase [unclassified Mesorhizobium]AZO01859.1 N-acetyltransferase [Mesorhizobium sp. M2A.F.Ca.ET.043.02.1.1]RUW41797.1 N-acetyltransferase [Mesorhizobium sp. M2A.F.Ca.ET.015.02.1.1]RUW65127.1 N-acetyltransferase [Mesorhizobium sp. M2A.F.Ca.ET.067.02.1.1]RVC95225.1 N-acetyltransferase [Mesorhizobium sp. M2A.F.Ca.ET.017.03.2.1]RVD03279.1 N-acetyltransferase [Mesorhizobium sp. M2A.F.Ca.ET.029.05.1.1]